MLIARKNSNLNRFITYFRFLKRLWRANLAFPLVTHASAILGSSKCDCLSGLDFKDAYYTIKLSESFKHHCGILPYFIQ